MTDRMPDGTIITPQAWANAKPAVVIRRFPSGAYGASCGYETIFATLDIVLAQTRTWLTECSCGPNEACSECPR